MLYKISFFALEVASLQSSYNLEECSSWVKNVSNVQLEVLSLILPPFC